MNSGEGESKSKDAGNELALESGSSFFSVAAQSFGGEVLGAIGGIGSAITRVSFSFATDDLSGDPTDDGG